MLLVLPLAILACSLGAAYPQAQFPSTTRYQAGQLETELVQVTETTDGGLQEHRVTEYSATGQETKPKEHVRTDNTIQRIDA
jgi:hypothetical protein